MASIKTIFKINEYGNGTIHDINSNILQNNISKKPYSTEIETKDKALTETEYEGFVIGTTAIGEDYVIDTDTYDGYMFSEVTDDDGNCELEIEIYGDDVISLIFYFDEVLQQYPKKYTVVDSNGITTEYENDKENPYIISIVKLVSGAYQTKRIIFNNWSRSNYNVCFKTLESVEVEIDLTKDFVAKAEFTLQKTSNASDINYGILASTGQLELTDKNNEIYKASQLGYLDSYTYSLYSYVNHNLVSSNISTDAPYYSQEKRLSISLSDEIALWNDSVFEEKEYESGTNLYQIISEVFDKLRYNSSDIEKMCSKLINTTYKDEVEDVVYEEEITIKEYLTSITMDAFKIEKTSIGDILNDICAVAQLNVYIDNDKSVKLTSARPLKTKDEEILVIPFTKQINQLEYDMVVSNRINQVEIGG